MATAIVTGFSPHAPLLRSTFEPLRAVHRAGKLDRILYVTWDKPELDACIAPVAAYSDVEIVRIPEPAVGGLQHHQASFICQSRNLAAALELVADPNELIVKLRPGFLFKEHFLAAKLASFYTWRRAPDFSHHMPVPMPTSPFAGRVWLPWATANIPFYMEDAAFIGCAGDLQRLADPLAEPLAKRCGDAATAIVAHALRFAPPFLDDYPIFETYLERFDLVRMDEAYRRDYLGIAVSDPFFWHLTFAHAWILATSFHVDCGRQGDLRFIQTATAQQHPNRSVAEIPDNVLFADVEGWRGVQRPGNMMSLVMRLCGRVVDDTWQQALFSGPIEGCTPENLIGVMQNVAASHTGLLGELEDAFYQRIQAAYRTHFRRAA